MAAVRAVSAHGTLQVAEALNHRRVVTLLFDLLLPEEENDRKNVFDIKLLGRRLVHTVRWIVEEPDVGGLPIGLFGASTGAAAALVAASTLGDRIGAVVSRGGRPDLAGDLLPQVKAPTLLIVGGADSRVIELNQLALELLGGEKSIEIVPGATHLFQEPGALEVVIEFAARLFERHLVVDPETSIGVRGNDDVLGQIGCGRFKLQAYAGIARRKTVCRESHMARPQAGLAQL